MIWHSFLLGTDIVILFQDKELIDAHTKEIDDLKNKEPFEMPAMPEMKGDGLDMGELMKLFACKTPPDNTIKRIEALEKELEDVKKRLAN